MTTAKSDRITTNFFASMALIPRRDVVAGLGWKPLRALAAEARQARRTVDLWAGGLVIPEQHLIDQSPKSAVQDQILPVGWGEDRTDRWPMSYSVAFVLGASALLWALILGAVNCFIG